MQKKKIIISAIILVLGVFGIVKVFNHLTDEVVVSGTVYGKNESTKTRYKSNVVSSEFWVAVHPDDTVKYKDYSVQVKYSTFARLKIGSHTQFRVLRYDVERNYNGYYNLSSILLFILGLLVFSDFCYILYIIFDK